MKIARIIAAAVISLLLTAQSASAAEDFVLPEYGEPITLPGVVPDPVPEALRPAVEAYEAGDYGTARTLLTPAAEEGAPVALYYMGLLHRFGQGGLEVDSEQGYALLEQAADAAAAVAPQDGFTFRKALYSMGYMVQHNAVMLSASKAGECLYLKSAQFGYSPAQRSFSNVLDQYPEKRRESYQWLERSAAQGNLFALRYNGFIKSINPIKSENPKGFMLMHLSALGGHSKAIETMVHAASLRDHEVNAQILAGIKMAESWKAVPEFPPSNFQNKFRDCYFD